MGRNDLLMDALAGLLDKQAIHELIMTYCRAVDRRDEAMMLATFHEDAIDDHGLADSTPKGLAAAIAASPSAQLMHFIGNVLIELDGDQAYCESYFISISIPKRTGKRSRVCGRAATSTGARSAPASGSSRIARSMTNGRGSTRSTMPCPMSVISRGRATATIPFIISAPCWALAHTSAERTRVAARAEMGPVAAGTKGNQTAQLPARRLPAIGQPDLA